MTIPRPHDTLNSGLERNSVGLPTVLMQSIAQIAPAVGVLTTIGFNTQQAASVRPRPISRPSRSV